MAHDNASPQVEEGHTRLANELLEAMCRAGFSARQWAVVMAVVRKTYGYGKKSDEIGLTQLEQMTGIAKTHVGKTVRELCAAGVLRRDTGVHGYRLGVNKRYGQWQLAALSGVTKMVTGVTESVTPNTVTKTVTPVTESVTTSGVTKSVTGGDQNSHGGDQIGHSDQIGFLGVTDLVTTKGYKTKERKHSRTILSDGTCDQAVPARQSGGADEPSPEFMTAWSAYPKREGGNPRKAAWTAWKARVRAGDATAQELVEATRGYAKFCDTGNKTGTQFVLMASTFYGPGEHWREWLPSTSDTAANAPGGVKPWYAVVGFSNQWEAENAGCTEGNRWMWENRQRVRTEQDWPAWKASQAAARGASE